MTNASRDSLYSWVNDDPKLCKDICDFIESINMNSETWVHIAEYSLFDFVIFVDFKFSPSFLGTDLFACPTLIYLLRYKTCHCSTLKSCPIVHASKVNTCPCAGLQIQYIFINAYTAYHTVSRHVKHVLWSCISRYIKSEVTKTCSKIIMITKWKQQNKV